MPDRPRETLGDAYAVAAFVGGGRCDAVALLTFGEAFTLGADP